MSSKLLIIFLSILAGVMAGLFLSKRLILRERYFDELIRIIDRLISDIKFSQIKIENILDSYTTSSVLLQTNLSEYKTFLQGGQLNLSKGVLTKRELVLVREFFLRLGSLDLETQIKELENRKEVFNSFLLDTRARNKSFGKAFVKLGFLGGLLVGILLL